MPDISHTIGRLLRSTYLKSAISLSLLIGLVLYFNANEILQTLVRLNAITLFGVLLLLSIQLQVSMVRWHYILKQLKLSETWGRSLDNYALGMVGNLVFLTSIGGMSLRALQLKRKGGSIKNIAIGLLYERALALIAIVSVFLIFSLLAFSQDSLPPGSAGKLAPILAIAVAVSLVGTLLLRIQPFHRLLRSRSIGEVARAISGTPMRFFSLVAASILIHLLGFVTVVTITYAVGVEVPILPLLVVLPLVAIVSSLPISIGGWGVREGSMVLGFSTLGVAPENALAISILYGLAGTVAALLLAAVVVVCLYDLGD